MLCWGQWQGGQGVKFDNDPKTYDLDKFVPLEVKAGTLVVLHGRLVHYSKENKSPVSRHAYSVHVVEGKPGVTYAADNW
jgi:phytanoyl-CoA hydroxylase